jgi:hypothetical protein
VNAELAVYYALRSQGVPAIDAMRHARLAEPIPVEGFEPLEGAEELAETVAEFRPGSIENELTDAYEYIAHLKKSIRNSDRDQLREDIDTLACDLAEAKRALREVASRAEAAAPAPYRSQAGVLASVGRYARESVERLEWECDRCGARQPTTYAPEYGANFCDACADPSKWRLPDSAEPESAERSPDPRRSP